MLIVWLLASVVFLPFTVVRLVHKFLPGVGWRGAG